MFLNQDYEIVIKISTFSVLFLLSLLSVFFTSLSLQFKWLIWPRFTHSCSSFIIWLSCWAQTRTKSDCRSVIIHGTPTFSNANFHHLVSILRKLPNNTASPKSTTLSCPKPDDVHTPGLLNLTLAVFFYLYKLPLRPYLSIRFWTSFETATLMKT